MKKPVRRLDSQIKIEGEVFEVDSQSIQYRNIPPYSCDITFRFNISKNPSYENFLTNLYDSSRKFDIQTTQLQIIGNNIKQLKIDQKYIEISLICERLVEIDISERRNQLIDSILNKT